MSGRSDSAHHPDVIRSELAEPRAVRRSYLSAHPRAQPATITHIQDDERFPSPAAVRRERDGPARAARLERHPQCRCGTTCPACRTDTALQQTCACFTQGLLFAVNDDPAPTVLHSRCAGCRAYVGWHQIGKRWLPIDDDGFPHNNRCPAIIKRRMPSRPKAP